MRLLNFLKRNKKEEKKPVLSREHKLAKENAIKQHKIRISNLSDEFERLSADLEKVEGNLDIPQSQRTKESDTLIRRITLIRYEIEVREGLIKWLS